MKQYLDLLSDIMEHGSFADDQKALYPGDYS